MPYKLGIYQVNAQGADVAGTSRFALVINEHEKPSSDPVLVPQPSADPNDPMNWNRGEKHTIIWAVAIVSSMAHVLGPMVTTSFHQVAVEFQQSMDLVTQSMSGNFHLMSGVGTLFMAAFGVTYGKRPVFLFSTALLVLTTAWVFFSRSFTSMTAARALEGMMSAPYEILSNGIVADICFVHERGLALAVVGSWALLALLIGQVGGGFVVQYLGWRRLFLIAMILLGVTLPVIYFLIPETVFRRSYAKESTQSPSLPELDQRNAILHDHIGETAVIVFDTARNSTRPPTQLGSIATSRSIKVMPQKRDVVGFNHDMVRKPYRMRLKLWNGILSDESYWIALIRPLSLLVYPAVIFGVVVHGLGSTWLNAFALAKLQLFTRAPYNLTPSQIGLTTLAGAATSTIAHPLAGWLSDYFSKALSRRNDGVYEAEFRLILMIPQALFSIIGFIGFGVSLQQERPLWIVLAFYSSVSFSIPFGSLASITYLIDSLESRNQEAMVVIILLKNIFLLIFASFINGWIERRGAKNVFVILGLTSFAFSLLTAVFYVYGKYMRVLVAKRMHRRLFARL